MRYYKECTADGKVCAVGSGDALNGEEITKEEYEALLAEIKVKGEYVAKVYQGKISIEAVPEEYRAEVQENVDAMIAEYGAIDPDEISDDEALAIIMGVNE